MGLGNIGKRIARQKIGKDEENKVVGPAKRTIKELHDVTLIKIQQVLKDLRKNIGGSKLEADIVNKINIFLIEING